ncbi:MAG: YraN family protein [Alphaproteobacteria bacterium]|nr:YraN family protein [Alphaproteobacteria bacterium]
MPAPSRSARNKRYRKGIRAEWVAAQHLRLRGWRIIGTRFKTPLGEIDLIAKRGRTIAFIEVKARASHQKAAEAIHHENQQRVVRAAQWFLSAHPNYADYHLRFDACLVPWYYWPTFIPHAFGA